MRRRNNRILNLLIIFEAAALVIVLIVGLMNTGITHLASRRSARTVEETETAADAEEQNAVDVNAVAESDEETEEAEEEPQEEADNSITDSGSAYEAITFSDAVMDQLDRMTTEQKVAQLFVTTPEALTGMDDVTIAGEVTRSAIETYPVGGLVYSSANIQTTTQAASLIGNTQEYLNDAVGVQMFAMIEELGGADHSPLANVAADITAADSPAELGSGENPDAITASAQSRADYVLANGFNTILGPVADVSTEGTQPEFDEATYGSSSGQVADCIEYDIEAVQSEGVMAVMRSFPGTYETTTDYSSYRVGIEAGVDCIMVSNQPDSTLTGEDGMPCSISLQVGQQLRMDMGFDGLLMTSDLTSGVVTAYCSTADAAVRAVNAGMDLIYVRGDFTESYEAVLDAVNDGSITENILNNAVGRILTEKMD